MVRKVYSQVRPEVNELQQGKSDAMAMASLVPVFHALMFVVALALEQTKILNKIFLPLIKPLCLTTKAPYFLVVVMIVWTFFITKIASLVVTSMASKKGLQENILKNRDELESLPLRIQSAHEYAIETFSSNIYMNILVFPMAIVIAHLTNMSRDTLNSFSLLYVICKILHTLCYIADIAILRTTFHTLGNTAVFLIFLFSGYKDFNKHYIYSSKWIRGLVPF